MSYEAPPILRLAERLLVEVEEAVRRFPRYHKYSLGQDLRAQTMAIARLCHRAWHDKAGQGHWLQKLVWAVDDLKISLQLGMRIKAFGSFHQFEQLALLTGELGKQSGGWHRQHLKGQQAASPAEPS